MRRVGHDITDREARTPMNAAHDPFADAQPAQHPDRPTADEPLSVPEANQRRWSGKKTAVVAALAVGLSSTVAVGAASALPLGSQAGGGDSGRGGHGGPGGPGGGHDGEGFRNGSGRFGGAVGGSTGSGSTSGSGSTTGQGGQGGTSWGTPPQGAPNLNGEVPTKPGGNPMPAS